jgi:signal recognition particle subunit SEC65
MNPETTMINISKKSKLQIKTYVVSQEITIIQFLNNLGETLVDFSKKKNNPRILPVSKKFYNILQMYSKDKEKSVTEILEEIGDKMKTHIEKTHNLKLTEDNGIDFSTCKKILSLRK